MNPNTYLFLFYSVLFWILSYLVIRKSKSPANLLFSSSTFLYGVATLFSALGWGPFSETVYSYIIAGFKVIINYLTFFAIAASLILLAPLGIYFSGRTILHGNPGYKDETAIILLVVFLILSIFNFFIYPILQLRQNFMFEDTLTAVILVFSLSVYYKLYIGIPDYKNNFILILLGLTAGFLSLILAITLFLLNQDTLAESARSIGPFLAVFIVLVSFTNLPQAVRNRNG